MLVFVSCPFLCHRRNMSDTRDLLFLYVLVLFKCGGEKGKRFLLSFRLNELKPYPVEMLLRILQGHLVSMNVAPFLL